MKASPAMRQALRACIDEVYRDEVELARLRHRIALVKCGVHPQLPLIDALTDWGWALHMRSRTYFGADR
jgi:hypothetical protein